jgi:hypothetical protein
MLRGMKSLFVNALAPKSFRVFGASAQANAGSTTESRFHSIKEAQVPLLDQVSLGPAICGLRGGLH